MSINATRFCPTCGLPADHVDRFCMDCGSEINGTTMNSTSTEFNSGSNAYAYAATSTRPEAEAVYTSGSSSPVQSSSRDMSQPSPVGNYQAPYQVVPDFAPPHKTPKSKKGRRFLIVVLPVGSVLLVLLALLTPLTPLGGRAVRYVQRHFFDTGSADITPEPNETTTAGPATSATANSNTGNVTFSPEISFIYANVKVSVLSVEQKPSLRGDPSKSGVLRLNIKEKCQPIGGQVYNYSYDHFKLVGADGTTTFSVGSAEWGASSIDPNKSRQNWLDFPTGKAPLDVSKLTLRVGADDEAQMNIPLQNNPDLSKYKPKSYDVNQPTIYASGSWKLTWNITKVTVSYSALGLQAKKGMVYVTISSSLSNNSTVQSPSLSSIGDLMSLQSGEANSTPKNNPFPDSGLPVGQSATGDTTFEMPQDSTNFTCTILGDDNLGTSTAKIQFRLS